MAWCWLLPRPGRSRAPVPSRRRARPPVRRRRRHHRRRPHSPRSRAPPPLTHCEPARLAELGAGGFGTGQSATVADSFRWAHGGPGTAPKHYRSPPSRDHGEWTCLSERGAARSTAVAERPPRTYGEPALLGVGEPMQTRAGARGPIDGLASDVGSRREDPSDGVPERLSGRRSEQGGAGGVVQQGGPGSRAAGMRSKPAGAAPPPRAGRREASIMSFIDLWSAAWSWATSFAILCLKVAKSASDAKASSSPSLPVIVPIPPSAVVLAGPLRNLDSARQRGRETEHSDGNSGRRGRGTEHNDGNNGRDDTARKRNGAARRERY